MKRLEVVPPGAQPHSTTPTATSVSKLKAWLKANAMSGMKPTWLLKPTAKARFRWTKI